MSTIELKHAFFSQEQKERLHATKTFKTTSIWLTTDGREVEVTELCTNADSYNKKGFPDHKYLGQVTKWLRVAPPELETRLQKKAK